MQDDYRGGQVYADNWQDIPYPDSEPAAVDLKSTEKLDLRYPQLFPEHWYIHKA